jgi:hypothetical protein
MVDISKYVSALAQRLQDDATLNALVDGQIIPGFRRAAADQFLAGTHHACIGIRSLSKNSSGLPGCAYHQISTHDHLIEIRIITQLSSSRLDDSDAYAIGHEVERLLKAGFEQTLNGVTYRFPVVPNINFTALDDDQITDRIEIQATIRLKYLDA